MAAETGARRMEEVQGEEKERRLRLARGCVNLSLLTSPGVAADLLDKAVEFHAALAGDEAPKAHRP